MNLPGRLFPDFRNRQRPAEDRLALDALFVGIIEIAVEKEGAVVVEGQYLRIIARADPIEEVRRFRDFIRQTASVSWRHEFERLAPFDSGIVSADLDEHSGPCVTYEHEPRLQAAQARQRAHGREPGRLRPRLAHVGRVRKVHRRPFLAGRAVPV